MNCLACTERPPATLATRCSFLRKRPAESLPQASAKDKIIAGNQRPLGHRMLVPGKAEILRHHLHKLREAYQPVEKGVWNPQDTEIFRVLAGSGRFQTPF